MIRNFISLFICVILGSCGAKNTSPLECVNTFITAAMNHDMTKAWGILGTEAQKYYNDIGEKNRKSGKGILEHDISEITKFKKAGIDFSLTELSKNEVKITFGNEAIVVSVTYTDGDCRIRDGNSVKDIIKAISAETVKKEYYF